MSERMPPDGKEDGTVYGEAAAVQYKKFDASGDCEANVIAWFRAHIEGSVPGKTVVDAGCGSGRFVRSIEDAYVYKYIGVDASMEMLQKVDGLNPSDILEYPLGPGVLQKALHTRRKLFIHGGLQDVLPELGPRMHVVLSSFNIVCFQDPAEPIDAIRSCLQKGGRLVCVTNTFAPAELCPDPSSPDKPMRIDDLSALRHQPANLNGKTRFRHILHLPDGKLPLQDHIHPLSRFAEILDPKLWKVLSVELYSTQGCTLADPGDPAHMEDFQEFGHASDDVLRPGDASLEYVKLCFVAEKLGA